MFVETDIPVITKPKPKFPKVPPPKHHDRPEPTQLTLRILTEARERIARGWCRGTESKYNPRGMDRSSYCTLGAIWASGGHYHDDSVAAQDAIAKAASISSRSYIPHWNDAQTSKKPVLEAFDLAIATVKRKLGL